mmetsp:Transcript_2604/g.6567  ORF Transcript_2604/g.6567 Transcript_2604/m.6567 type:complete len:324 (-) Transcript_2604:863-1834(-)
MLHRLEPLSVWPHREEPCRKDRIRMLRRLETPTTIIILNQLRHIPMLRLRTGDLGNPNHPTIPMLQEVPCKLEEDTTIHNKLQQHNKHNTIELALRLLVLLPTVAALPMPIHRHLSLPRKKPWSLPIKMAILLSCPVEVLLLLLLLRQAQVVLLLLLLRTRQQQPHPKHQRNLSHRPKTRAPNSIKPHSMPFAAKRTNKRRTTRLPRKRLRKKKPPRKRRRRKKRLPNSKLRKKKRKRPKKKLMRKKPKKRLRQSKRPKKMRPRNKPNKRKKNKRPRNKPKTKLRNHRPCRLLWHNKMLLPPQLPARRALMALAELSFPRRNC